LYCTTSYDFIVVFLHLAIIMQQKQYLDLDRLAKINVERDRGMKLKLMILGSQVHNF
jgi:hypothetical protein